MVFAKVFSMDDSSLEVSLAALELVREIKNG